ncbi:acyltransferase [Erythrobacter sp. LQ02-29]|uniref:acyltransferase family protein n=1 Tax=Erythrobacter sp. LQ02-29 TaxID=2920384 RepID=UPI001F4DACA7|nr:acyltransferase [Erythrobacter sp. LQ02-29]MCP9222874.1 acyltransferase [Erythrobacter sp. LQ02-29]
MSEITASDKKPRELFLDTAKGFSIVLVVFWHAIAAAYTTIDLPRDSIYVAINNPLLQIRMPLFFFVSGLVFSHTLSKGWATFFRKRLLTMIWLFTLWTFLYALRGREDPEWVLSSFYNPPIHLWFLWGLVIYRFTARAAVSMKLPAILIAAALSILSFAGWPQNLWGALSTHQTAVAKDAVFYLFGIWFAMPWVRYLVARPITIGTAALLLAIISGKLGFNAGLAVFGTIVGLSIAKIITDHLEAVRALFTYLGRHSLEIFILHFGMMWPLMSLFRKVTEEGIEYWAVPLGTAIAVFVSVVIRNITDRFAPWLFVLPKFLAKGERPGLADERSLQGK